VKDFLISSQEFAVCGRNYISSFYFRRVINISPLCARKIRGAQKEKLLEIAHRILFAKNCSATELETLTLVIAFEPTWK
jgi:hypothetical protein